MTAAPTPDLLPCPFCGSAKVTTKNEHTDLSGGYYIECSACLACTGLRYACGEDPRPLLAEQWNRRAELEARKPLPLSYRAGAMTSSVDGGATVSLHFNDMAEAEAWFVAITDQHDAGLASKATGPLPGIKEDRHDMATD